MKRFHFALEQFLRLREYEEQQAELELGRVTGECERLRKAIVALEDAGRSVAQTHLGSRAWDVVYRLDEERYIAGLASRAAGLTEELRRWEGELDKARERFREARKKREVLSRLKGRRAEQYHDAVQSEQQRVLDEASLVKWRSERYG
ncbi:MAG: flagellar export protein FliJ [Spirochaetaceae bacterium]